MKQLEKSEFIFSQIFESMAEEKVSIKKVVAIPPSKNPQLQKKSEAEKVSVIIFNYGEEPDFNIFSNPQPG